MALAVHIILAIICSPTLPSIRFLYPRSVHLHNSLVLGILYNASSAVPGPSASRKGWGTSGAFSASHSDHQTSIRQAEAEAYQHENGDFEAEDVDPEAATASIEPEKRVNILAASFTTAERQRIKSMSKPLSRNLSSIANTSSWAGAGADLLERKRKEEEKKTKETERKRLKEQHTEIGGRDWLKEVIAEELACQENRASLPAGKLQSGYDVSPQVLTVPMTRIIISDRTSSVAIQQSSAMC